jgi:hypothetical protein
MTDSQLIALLAADFTNVGHLAAMKELAAAGGLERVWRIYYSSKYRQRWEALAELGSWTDWVNLHADSALERHAAVYYWLLVLDQATDAELRTLAADEAYRGTAYALPMHTRAEAQRVLEQRVARRRSSWLGAAAGAVLGSLVATLVVVGSR